MFAKKMDLLKRIETGFVRENPKSTYNTLGDFWDFLLPYNRYFYLQVYFSLLVLVKNRINR